MWSVIGQFSTGTAFIWTVIALIVLLLLPLFSQGCKEVIMFEYWTEI